ncbi:MAG: Bax inhibitor-1 family protein [Desulfatibacillaceae bacterium]
MQQQPQYAGAARAEVRVNSFVRSVYNWMVVGLALTGGIALFVANTPPIFNAVARNPILLIAIILAELGLVVYLAARIQKMSAQAATAAFVIYASLNGVVFSIIFQAYTQASIARVFFICAGMFLGCSVYGWITKRDLTSLGGFMFMGLIGIIIAMVVNWFLHSSALHMAISVIGVFVFLGLTAYDTQKIKNMAETQPADADGALIRKGAIMGALSLYLDFINLFLFLLRLFGERR